MMTLTTMTPTLKEIVAFTLGRWRVTPTGSLCSTFITSQKRFILTETRRYDVAVIARTTDDGDYQGDLLGHFPSAEQALCALPEMLMEYERLTDLEPEDCFRMYRAYHPANYARVEFDQHGQVTLRPYSQIEITVPYGRATQWTTPLEREWLTGGNRWT